MSKPADLGTVKVGSYIVIEDEPCKIISFDHSKPGKHGSAKARIVAIGLFDGVKRSHVGPVSENILIPMIDKRTGQVISQSSAGVQLMDMETFEVFEAVLPDDKNITDRIDNGVEVEYWRALGKQKIVRVR